MENRARGAFDVTVGARFCCATRISGFFPLVRRSLKIRCVTLASRFSTLRERFLDALLAVPTSTARRFLAARNREQCPYEVV